MKIKLFVVFFFFMANVYTNVAVCSSLLSKEKAMTQTQGFWSPDTNDFDMNDLLSQGLPPEIPSENHEEEEEQKGNPNMGMEDEHFITLPEFNLDPLKDKNWLLGFHNTNNYFDILLPPPEFC